MLRAQLLVQKYRDTHIANQKSWFSQQVQANRAQAVKNFTAANILFQKGEYRNALPLLESCTQLDASNDDYYYYYALALYKLKRYRRSLAFLNILEATSINQTELNYYEALNHLYLKEEDLAYNKFVDVREQKDPDLSAMAAMYAGILAQKKEDYADARINYEFILDFSKNPKLDQKAEMALDNLSKIEQFQALAKQKWGYSFYTSVISDSNVLNVAKTSQPTSVEAYRVQYGAIVAYKALFTQKRSLMPQFTISDMYSVSTKFKSETSLQAADPFQVEVSVPYRQVFSLFKKPSSWLISPAYSQLYMSIDEDGRDLVFASTSLTSNLTTTHFKKWISDYNIIISSDDSHLVNASSLDNQTAIKYSLLTNQTRLLDPTGRKSVGFSLLYSLNDADGDNNVYNKYILSITGTRPISEKLLGYARIDYTKMDFPDAVSGRKDTGFILNAGAFYSWTQRSSFNLMVQYYDNDSSVAIYDYKKTVASLMYVYRGGFF